MNLANLDGKLFRAGGVKVVHNGVEPEGKINEYLKKMIDLTSRTDIPELLRTIASHYVFGIAFIRSTMETAGRADIYSRYIYAKRYQHQQFCLFRE